jgi:hypothetical protein
MAEFFDQKEEVLDIELTQHGKYLLSKGLFKPDSYAFFDDDIIYDTNYAGHAEVQNDAHDRIKTSIRPKAQYVFRGIETEFRKTSKLRSLNFGKDIDKPQSTGDKSYGLINPIGFNKSNSDRSSAWSVFFAKAPLSSSAAHYTGSHGFVKIPQMEMVHKISTLVGMNQIEAELEFIRSNHTEHEIYQAKSNMDKFREKHGTQPEVFSVSEDFEDGTFLFEEQDYVFLTIKEQNTPNLRENFDIEVFEIREETDGVTGASKETLRQLQFLHTPTEIDDFIKETGLDKTYPPATPDHVEYYFALGTDQDIEERILCEVEFDNKKEDIFADSNIEFDCIYYPYMEAPIVYSERQVDLDGALITVPEGEEDPCE